MYLDRTFWINIIEFFFSNCSWIRVISFDSWIRVVCLWIRVIFLPECFLQGSSALERYLAGTSLPCLRHPHSGDPRCLMSSSSTSRSYCIAVGASCSKLAHLNRLLEPSLPEFVSSPCFSFLVFFHIGLGFSS